MTTKQPQAVSSSAAQQKSLAGSLGGGSEKSKFPELNNTFEKLKNLSSGWDSYDAAPPNSTALARARNVFALLLEINFEPTRITASVEGGIGFIFTRQDRYADIECLNSGNLVAVTYINQAEPVVWSVKTDSSGIKETLEKIRAFLNA